MAYTITANTPGRFTTNAEFQTWGSWISNAIGNTGLVQTADTGQINWSTTPAPNTTGQIVGYEVWRFNDALQNTAPVFLKLEYGSSASGQTIPVLRWTLGSGSSGNGTLTGFLSRDQSGATGNPYTLAAAGGAFANSTLQSYIAGGTNWLVLALNVRGTGSAASYGITVGWERTVDANGDVTADGVITIFRNGASPTYGQHVWNPIIGWVGNDVTADGWGVLAPERGGGTTGSNVAVYPVFTSWGGGAFLNPSLNFLCYWHSEISAGSSNTFTYYGASHTYMPLGNTAVYGMSPRGNNALCAMMRWE